MSFLKRLFTGTTNNGAVSPIKQSRSSWPEAFDLSKEQVAIADAKLRGSQLESIIASGKPFASEKTLNLGTYYGAAAFVTGDQIRKADEELKGSSLLNAIQNRGGKPFLDI